MKLSELLKPIKGLTATTSGWTGLCPAHEDSSPSLSVSVGTSGNLLVKCHKQCDFKQIAAASGFEQSDYFNVEIDLENVSTVAPGAAALPEVEVLLELKEYCDRAMELYLGSPAQEYVEERFGVCSELAIELGLGYDPTNIPLRYLSKTRYRDQPRLVVPFKTADGVIVGMQGRRLGDGDSPKWSGPANPPNASWSTVAVWLGEDDTADLLIVEGASDYLAGVSSHKPTMAVRGASLAKNLRVQDTIKAHGQGRRIFPLGDADSAGDRFNDHINNFCRDEGLLAYRLPIGRGNDLSDWRQLAGAAWDDEFAEAIRNASLISELADERWLKMLKTDDHNGRELMTYVGEDYCFCPALGWLNYSQGIYKPDTLDQLTTEVTRMLDEMVELGDRAAVAGEEDGDAALQAAGRALYGHAKNSLNLPKRDNVKKAAQSKRTIDFSQLDTHRDLLVAADCVIDLRDGSRAEHDRQLYMTSGIDIAYDPDATCPRFDQFMDEITQGDKEIAAFLNRLIGYAITGRTDEQIAVQLWGRGSNGKSVFLNAIRHVFEPITAVAAFSTFEKKSGNSGSSDIAELAGARIAIATEGERQAPIQEAVLKRVTGSDPLSAAHKYRNHFTFIPRFLLILATNYRLAITGQDEGIWRRMVSVPFQAEFKGANRDIFLEDKLKAEAQGILAWAVRGAVSWYDIGLSTPQIVLDAVQEHRDSSDVLLGFIPGVVSSYTFDPTSTPSTPASTPPEAVSGTSIYQAYMDWCVREMVKPMSKRALFEAICERLPDVEKIRRNSGMHFENVVLNPSGVGGAASS
jgi:putative DNA primase/helicase